MKDKALDIAALTNDWKAVMFFQGQLSYCVLPEKVIVRNNDLWLLRLEMTRHRMA